MFLYTSQMEVIYYTPDSREHAQACVHNLHYLWDDIQLSKGSWNKDRDIIMDIDGKKNTFCIALLLVMA